jgi:head-tail adaptor
MTRGDPATETWRETVRLSTSAQLRQTQAALAASQEDLTRAHDVIIQLNDMLTTARRELAKLHETCAWRDLAVTAMRERDTLRAQLDGESGRGD